MDDEDDTWFEDEAHEIWRLAQFRAGYSAGLESLTEIPLTEDKFSVPFREGYIKALNDCAVDHLVRTNNAVK